MSADITPLVCLIERVGPDAVAVEAFARLRLAALRRGRPVELRTASRELVELITLCGLRDAIRPVLVEMER